MAKMRVYEVARKLNVSSSRVMELLKERGMANLTASSGLDDNVAEYVEKKLKGETGNRKTEMPGKALSAGNGVGRETTEERKAVRSVSLEEGRKTEQSVGKAGDTAAGKSAASSDAAGKPVNTAKSAEGAAGAGSEKKKSRITRVYNPQNMSNPQNRSGGTRRDGRARPAGERQGGRIFLPDDDRRAAGQPRPEGERRPTGQPRAEGERRPAGQPRAEGERRPVGQPRPEGERRPVGQPRAEGERRPAGQPRAEGERRTVGQLPAENERRPAGQPRPEGEKKPTDQISPEKGNILNVADRIPAETPAVRLQPDVGKGQPERTPEAETRIESAPERNGNNTEGISPAEARVQGNEKHSETEDIRENMDTKKEKEGIDRMSQISGEGTERIRKDNAGNQSDSQGRETAERQSTGNRNREDFRDGGSRGQDSQGRDGNRQGRDGANRDENRRSQDGANRDGGRQGRDGASRDGNRRSQDSQNRDGANRDGNRRSQDGVNRDGNRRGQDGQNRDGANRDGNRRGQDGASRDGSRQGRDGANRDGNRRGQDGQNRDGANRDGSRRSQDGQNRDNRQGRDGAGRDGMGRANRDGAGRRTQDGGDRSGYNRRGQDGQGAGAAGRSYRDGAGRDGSRSYGTRDGGAGRDAGRGSQGGFRRDGGAGRDGGFNRDGAGQGQNRDGAGRRGQDAGRRRSSDGAMRGEGIKEDAAFRQGKNDRKSRQERNKQENRERSFHQEKAIKTPVKQQAKPKEAPEEKIKLLVLPETISIKELADKMSVQPSALLKKLLLAGTIVNLNQEIDYEMAEQIALEYDIICEKEEKVDVIAELLKEDEEDESLMQKRPPVVCVMGHVDHGKTSLLDAIRKTNVIAHEAGGITQHIGAYTVEIDGRQITFLDTPGHEAFTAMRMRGAQATDIAILVVAADDGVMPQTVEAINHAKAANISIIVAINKIDKPGANVERVKQELTEHGLVAESWGGNTIMVPVSAHTGEGIEELLEMVLLDADINELKANPERKARGIVIEAKLDKGRGPVMTVLVQKGTLHVGENVAVGEHYGKVRSMINDKGRRVDSAGPSVPVEIAGMNGVPNAGEIFIAMDNEKDARTFAETFIAEGRKKLIEGTKAKMSLDDLYSQIKAGDVKELDIVVKADVQGSVEAVRQSLEKLSNDEVIVKVIHGGVGAINESDVTLASASNAIVIGFNVKPDNQAKDIAQTEHVDLRLYSVIYNAIADVELAMKGMLDPIFEERVIGHGEVRQTFRASGVGTIAGAYVLDGIFERGCKCRITRGKDQIFDGELASLKRFKDDAKEVRAGYECGCVFEKFNDLQEGDLIEAYAMVEVPRV